MTKDQVALTNSLAVFKHAVTKVGLYPSKADDTGTDSRTGKHFLTTMASRFTGTTEIASTQAAVSLLGMPSQDGSAKTGFVFVQNAIAAVKSRQLQWEGKNPAMAFSTEPDGGAGKEGKDDDFEHLDYQWGLEEELGSQKPDPTAATKSEKLRDDEEILPHDSGKARWGSIPLYPVRSENGETKLIPIAQDVHYAHRGEALKDVPLLAYPCLFEVVKIEEEKGSCDNDDDKDEAKKERRSPNTVFPFSRCHPLHATYTQRIRSKLLIPVLSGPPPPSLRQLDSAAIGYTNATKAGKAELERGARYFMTLASPWTLQAEPGEPQIGELVPRDGTDWADFVDFMRHNSGADHPAGLATFVGDAITRYLTNVTRSLRVNSDNKKMTIKFRSEAASQWAKGDLNVCNIVKYFASKWGTTNQDAGLHRDQAEREEEEDILKEIEQIRERAQPDDPDKKPTKEKAARYHAESSLALSDLFGEESAPAGSILGERHEIALVETATEQGEMGSCQRLWKVLKDKEERETPDLVPKAPDADELGGKAHTPAQSPGVSQEPKLTDDQHKVLIAVRDYAEAVEAWKEKQTTKEPDQLLLLISGGPGVGKTFTINAIRSLLEAKGIRTLSTAYTGAAASIIPTAETIHSLFALSPREGSDSLKPLEHVQKAAALRKFEGVSVIIVDEVSMVSGVLLGKINERLCQLLGYTKPFGGISFILVGDFLQLKPVGGASLFDDLVNLHLGKAGSNRVAIKINPLHLGGVTTFSKFVLMELKEQVRAAEDQVQSRFLQELRDLTREKPVSTEIVTSLQQHTLSKKDSRDPSWRNATVCVTSNPERAHLTPFLATKFAMIHHGPLITWNKPVKGKLLDLMKARGIPESEVFTLQSGFIGMFTPDAPAFLTENINPGMGLANGTFVRMHSLTFSEMAKVDEAALRAQIANAAPGQRIHLEVPPSFINVSVELPDHVKSKWPAENTLVKEECVIPIGLCTLPEKINLSHLINTTQYSGTVRVQNHRVELGFAVTFHKIQGKTLSKLILELNQRPFNPQICFNSLLVAISRVTSREGLRVLKARSPNSFLYLTRLKPDPSLKTWLSGFDEKGCWSSARMTGVHPKPAILREPLQKGTLRSIKSAEVSKPAINKPARKIKDLAEPAHPPQERGFPWAGESCHLDAFLEGCFAVLLNNPPNWLLPMPLHPEEDLREAPTRNELLKTIMRVRMHSLAFTREQLSVFRETFRLRVNFEPFEGKFGERCDVMHWAEAFTPDLETSFGTLLGMRFTRTKFCCCGQRDENSWRIEVPLPLGPASLGLAIEEHLKGAGMCRDCRVPTVNVVSHLHLPPIFLVSTLIPFTLGAEEIVFGHRMRVVAAARHVNNNHFVTYVWRNGNIFLYDDIYQGGALTPAVPTPMRGQPSAVFLGVLPA